MEAEHAIDDQTPLCMYDCLIPKIKEHRRFRISKDTPFSIADFKSQQKILEMQQYLEQRSMPRALLEIEAQKKKIFQLESELAVVQWYLATIEAGVDTRNIVEEYSILRRRHDETVESTTKRLDQLERANERLTKELETALATIKR